MKKVIPTLLFALPFVGVFSGCDAYGRKVERDDLQVYYTENVQESEANQVLSFCAKMGWAQKGKPKAIQIRKEGSRYQFRVVIKKGMENQPVTKISMGAAAIMLSNDVFNNAAVDVHLCDNRFKTLVEVPFRNVKGKS